MRSTGSEARGWPVVTPSRTHIHTSMHWSPLTSQCCWTLRSLGHSQTSGASGALSHNKLVQGTVTRGHGGDISVFYSQTDRQWDKQGNHLVQEVRCRSLNKANCTVLTNLSTKQRVTHFCCLTMRLETRHDLIRGSAEPLELAEAPKICILMMDMLLTAQPQSKQSLPLMMAWMKSC